MKEYSNVKMQNQSKELLQKSSGVLSMGLWICAVCCPASVQRTPVLCHAGPPGNCGVWRTVQKATEYKL